MKQTDKLSSDCAPFLLGKGVLGARSRPLCLGEKHLLKELGSVIALPTGIPLVRISGSHHHLEPYLKYLEWVSKVKFSVICQTEAKDGK